MVLISRTPPHNSARHYVGRFTLTEEEKRPTPPKPVPPSAHAQPMTAPPKAAPPPAPGPSRIVVIPPKEKRPYTKRSAERPANHGAKKASAQPDKGLTTRVATAPSGGRVVSKPIFDRALQDSILEGLEYRNHLIRSHVMEEVKQVVLGERTQVTHSLLDVERRIFTLLRVPGF